MNFKQLRYVVELSKVLNFSKVSEKFNITQPALSKQIMLLEKDLQLQLFDRKCMPMRLTPAGEFFVREAQELIQREDRLKRSMERFRTGESGTLRIGASPYRSLYLLPPIVKKLRERFGGVQISLFDANNEQVREAVSEGKLDFAIVNLPVDDLIFDYKLLDPDVLVLVAPKEMARGLVGNTKNEMPEISISDCKDLPFVVVESSREMRSVFDRLCVCADIQPNIVMEVVGITSAMAMVEAGVGATVVPLQFVGSETFNRDNVALFKIKDNYYQRQPVVIVRRGQYLSEYAEYAIGLLSKKEWIKGPVLNGKSTKKK